MVASSPLELFRWADENRLVYCGGRGITKDGAYLANCFAGSDVANGPRGFHCSSWTNFVASYMTGLPPEEYTHRGNMPSLFFILENTGKNVVRVPGARPFLVQCFGDRTTKVLDQGTIDDLLEAIKPGELILAGESTKSGARWKFWHHTSAWFRDEEGQVWRCAADGSRTRAGWSLTPMKVRPVGDHAMTRLRATKLYRAYRLDWQPGVFPLGLV